MEADQKKLDGDGMTLVFVNFSSRYWFSLTMLTTICLGKVAVRLVKPALVAVVATNIFIDVPHPAND